MGIGAYLQKKHSGDNRWKLLQLQNLTINRDLDNQEILINTLIFRDTAMQFYVAGL